MHQKLFGIIMIGTLSILRLHAGSTTVLEGFEQGFTINSQGVTNIQEFTRYGTPRGNPVTISLYTSAGPGDPRVTEGTNSAKIVFPNDGFGNDFGFGLSDAACGLIEQAASSNQVARFILRYDVIFENINQLSFFNQTCFIGNDWDYVRSGGAVLTTYGGKQFGLSSYSVPLELPALAIPTNAPTTNSSADFAAAGIGGLVAFVADQFQAKVEPLRNYAIYIDNVRLIDTYETSETTPIVYPLQSFENTAIPLSGQATDLAPTTTTLSLYTTNGLYNPATDSGTPDAFTGGDPTTLAQESDFAVTDGTNCLQVVCNAPYYNYDIFSVPFAGTRLAQILGLKLTPAQLAHYTLRWDVTTPMVPSDNGGVDADYFQIDYNATSGSIFPMSTGRRQNAHQTGLQRETYSTTLDQIASWGASPSVAVSCSEPGGTATWGKSPFYFDNFVLINTAPQSTYITSESFNPATEKFTLVWLSEPGQTYAVRYSPALANGFTTLLATNISSGGGYTTNTVSMPGGAAGYLQVVAP